MTEKETKIVFLILLAILLVTGLNMVVALRKARDVQRKGDIREYTRFLETFQSEKGFIPAATDDGLMIACDPEPDGMGGFIFHPCDWDPDDPHSTKGIHYYYLASAKNWQVFAALEGKNEAEYDPAIEARDLPCGIKQCNFGLTSGPPLDKSIEIYENEISE